MGTLTQDYKLAAVSELKKVLKIQVWKSFRQHAAMHDKCNAKVVIESGTYCTFSSGEESDLEKTIICFLQKLHTKMCAQWKSRKNI